MPDTHVQLLGSGDAFHTDGRGAACIVVRPGAAGAFLVDLGPTAAQALERERVGPVDRLFLTHLHGDHVAGWPFLLLKMKLVERRTRPIEVWGARGSRACLETLARLCYGDVLEHGDLGFPLRYRELEVRETDALDAGGMEVDVVPMEHHPTSIGYRFRLAGARIAVSGDTRWCGGLERLAAETDLLFLECTTLEPSGHTHVSLAELRAARERLGAARIVLTHLTDAVAAELAADPLPDVVAGYDGLALSL